MKKIGLFVMIVFAAGAVSCSKAGFDSPGAGALMVIPSSSTQTKAAVSGELSSDYTIFLSSYFNNETSEKASGNYSVAEPFTRTSEGWSATPVMYWPMGGNLDFLAIAAKDLDVRGLASWYGGNATKGVELTVPERSCMDSEVMYAKASSCRESAGSVRLGFLHTQSWLQFQVAPFETGTTRIDSIVIRKTYLGGTLRIDNGVFLSAGWDYHGMTKKDYTLPESRNLVLEGPPVTMNVLLPEQDACDISVYFTQKEPDEPSWDNYSRKSCFTQQANADPWYAGERTLYTMTVHKNLTMNATVHGWTEDNKQIKIE